MPAVVHFLPFVRVQEDKEPLFDAIDTMHGTLAIAQVGMV